ncbi:MAG: hypothetical protein BWY57_01273 [Betaproteobacteria bacterium ADurb.Bin341]|nr:MAG: hypothetical protein BWY57_01273 [Betaproteobacteria bacterium ADurb.Bin341]
MLETLAFIAIVTQNQVALRAAPYDSAQQQAVLWQGDSLEIRGRRMDYLQVYDHRRERAGYILASQVRGYSMKPDGAPELLAVSRFLRETPGSEALGIAVTAAFLKAAPPEAIGAEAFDQLGTFAERLARRASSRQASQGKQNDSVLAAHLEVATSYGVTLTSFEREGRVQICYNGDAFRRVMALPANPEQKARAALALTRHDCVDPNLPPLERQALDLWRADVLDRVDLTNLPDNLKNRVHLRRAGVWAAIAHHKARQGEAAAKGMKEAANRAIDALAAINKTELSEEDAVAYNDAAIRVGASRWAAVGKPFMGSASKLSLETKPGKPGETCVQLLEEQSGKKVQMLERCSYGVVWKHSFAVNINGTAATLAVQPLATWRELWVFQKKGNEWSLTALPPALNNPELGYLEFAGWVPGGKQLLAAREAKVDGRFRKTFELVKLDTLEIEKKADKPDSLSLFYRWQSPEWKRTTLTSR